MNIDTGSNSSWVVRRVIAGIGALPCTAYALLVLRAQAQNGFDPMGAVFGSAFAVAGIVCWWFAFRGYRADTRARIAYILMGGLIVGGISFAAGFFGPIILTPASNQGPLLGIFITGPIGFVAGVLIGAVYALFRVRPTSPGSHAES